MTNIVKRCPSDGHEDGVHAVECGVCFGPLKHWCTACQLWLGDSPNCKTCADRKAAVERLAYYYAKAGRQNGPVTMKDLERLATNRELVGSDLVWQEGTPEWIPADRLGIVFPPTPPPLPGLPGFPIKLPFTWPPTFLKPTGKRIMASVPPKDPFLAAALSGFCLPGLGQIILGQTAKGVTLLIASILLTGIAGGLGFVMWPVLAVDAYMIAQRLRNGQAVGEWDFFNSNFS